MQWCWPISARRSREKNDSALLVSTPVVMERDAVVDPPRVVEGMQRIPRGSLVGVDGAAVLDGLPDHRHGLIFGADH